MEILTVADSGEPAEASEGLLEMTASILNDVETTRRRIESDDVAGSIVEATADVDMTVIGASRESMLQQLVVGAIPETVGRRAQSTVIMAKRDLGITSFVTRWLRGYRR
ncbi:cationic amino acid transporter [Haloarcula argentinensis DSM 12282]|nr:cationic amino acid transporter [Haloarcula argentinensis DSM 12282]